MGGSEIRRISVLCILTAAVLALATLPAAAEKTNFGPVEGVAAPAGPEKSLSTCPENDCFCDTLFPSGRNECFRIALCIDLPQCEPDGDCPDGFLCQADSGCVGNICSPVCGNCVGCDNPDSIPCEKALSVELESLSATVEGAGVRVRWATNAEVDNAGFRLLRAVKVDAIATGTKEGGIDLQVVSREFIAAQGTATSGASYEFLDKSAKIPGVTYYYYLEDVNLLGEATVHGPAAVRVEEVKPRTKN